MVRYLALVALASLCGFAIAAFGQLAGWSDSATNTAGAVVIIGVLLLALFIDRRPGDRQRYGDQRRYGGQRRYDDRQRFDRRYR
jgi:hypothetical protein